MTTALTTTNQAAGALVGAQAADWQQIAADWLTNIKSERTRRAYLEGWRVFLVFAQVAPDAVTESHTTAYRAMLKGEGYSQSTINQRLSAISSFYSYAKRRGLCAVNPCDGVNRETVKPYGKATWLNVKDGEDLAFVDSIDTTTDQGRRDYAIMLMILTGGFRVSEVANLTVGQLRRQGRNMFVSYTRKGGISEDVPLAPEAAQAIDDYLSTRQGLTGASPLFTATERGRRAAAHLGHDAQAETPLTDRAIRGLVKTYANRALGAGHKIHPHSLRHTAAKIADREGRSFSDISRLLKHSNAATTAIYMQSTSDNDQETAETMGRRFAKRRQQPQQAPLFGE